MKEQRVLPFKSLSVRVFVATLGSFFFSTLTASLGSIVDGFVVGHTMGTAAAGACSLVHPLAFLFAMISGVLCSGFQQHCTSYLAKGETEKARKLFSLVLIVGIGISAAVMAVILVANYPMTKLLGAQPDSEVFAPARAYLIGTVIGLPAISATSFFSSGAQIEGARQWPLAATIAMTATNIGGDLICAHHESFGIFGMALVTSISYYVAVLLLIPYFMKPGAMLKPIIRMDMPWKELLGIVRQGLPMGTSRLTTAWRGTCINHLLATHVTVTGLAAYNVQVQFNFLTNAFFLGVAQTLVLMASVYYTEEDRENLKRVAKVALFCGIIIGFFISVLVKDVFHMEIARFYLGDNQEAVDMANYAIIFFGISLPFQGLTILFANYLQATKRIAVSNFVYILSDVVFVSLTLFLCRGLGFLINEGDETVIRLTFIAIALAYILSVIAIPVIMFFVNLISTRRLRPCWDWFLMLPKGFGFDKDHELTSSIKDLEEATSVSRKIWSFCKEHNISEEKTYRVSLAAEELAVNIIKYGFADNKKHLLELRLVIKEDCLILRLRDDCRRFDPKEYYEKILGEGDEQNNLGIRMVMKAADDVSYTSAFKLNNMIIKI